jgi:hypothetical protein
VLRYYQDLVKLKRAKRKNYDELLFFLRQPLSYLQGEAKPDHSDDI